MAKKPPAQTREEIRVEDTGQTPEQIVNELAGDAAPPASEAPPPDVPRRRGRPPGSANKPKRDYKAERAKRAARGNGVSVLQQGPPPPLTPEQIAAMDAEGAAQLKPLVLELGGVVIPERLQRIEPYDDPKAERLAGALAPVMRKHAPALSPWGEEIALGLVLASQALIYWKIWREIKERERAKPTLAISGENGERQEHLSEVSSR